jgi:glycosyltransferase involved in cell wall biosynthesis
LRILVLNWRDVSHPIAGGAEVYIHEMMKRWVSSNCEVTQICARYRNSKARDEIDGVRIIRVGNTYTLYIRVAFELLKRKNSYDVVFESINTVPFFAPLFANKPVVALVYEYVSPLLLAYESPVLAVPSSMLQSLVPLVYRNSTIITISESAKKQLVDFALNPQRIFIVRPGVDSTLYEDCDINQKRFSKRVVYLGRLVKYKGLLGMVKEFRKVVDCYPSAEFYIIGRGYLLPKILELIQRLKLDQNVIIPGFVSEKEKKCLLFNTAVTVYPADYFDGGWSIAEAETMSLGNVLVATVNLQDMVYESKAGFVGPVNTFSKYICKLFENETLWKELSIKTADWARQFTLDKIARETLCIISETVRRDVDKKPKRSGR